MSLEETTRLNASAVTYAPYTGKFYHGSIGVDADFTGNREKEYHPIAQVNLQAAANNDYGGLLEPIDYELYRKWDRIQSAGTLTPAGMAKQAASDNTSLANLTRVELSTVIINELYKNVFLHLGAHFVPVPKLKLDYDVMLHLQVRGKANLVKKRMKSQVEAPQFVQTPFDLATYGKLQRTIDTPDEDELVALISPMKYMLSDAAKVIGQDINMLILEDGLQQFKDQSGLAEAFGETTTTQADKRKWDSFASGEANQNVNNPLTQIAEETLRIERNHGHADTIAMNRHTYAAFVSNTHVRGYEQMLTQESSGTFSFSKLPGLTFIVDADVPDGEWVLYTKNALTVGDGPMVTEAFRDPLQGVSGHVVRKWIQPVVNDTLASAFGSRITGTVKGSTYSPGRATS